MHYQQTVDLTWFEKNPNKDQRAINCWGCTEYLKKMNEGSKFFFKSGKIEFYN